MNKLRSKSLLYKWGHILTNLGRFIGITRHDLSCQKYRREVQDLEMGLCTAYNALISRLVKYLYQWKRKQLIEIILGTLAMYDL